jgi:thiamine-monophosphate kinase
MNIRELGEFEFIDRITPGCLVGRPEHVVQGIGDDAAVVRAGDHYQLVTTDMLIERVHFVRGTIDPKQLGYKALAVNLSDIAAMGGSASDAYLSIAVPPDMAVEELDQIYDGMKRLAREAVVNLLGGDTTASRCDLCLSVVVIGSVPRDQVLYRAGAKVGDRLLVTGTLGDAAGGLEVLMHRPEINDQDARRLVEAHCRPELYLQEARMFAESGVVHAAIDLSDGLASDVRHICRRSGVGARIEIAGIPISDALRALCRSTGQDPTALALAGGEDYRLLIAVEPGSVPSLKRHIADATGRQLYEVGAIVEGGDLEVRQPSGTIEPMTALGWDPFRSPWLPGSAGNKL